MLKHACLLIAASTLLAYYRPCVASAQFQDSHAHLNGAPPGGQAPPSDGRGELRVRTNVEGASVQIDGSDAGTAPFRGRLEPGRHRIEVEAEGMKRWRGDVLIAAGETTRADVELQPTVPRGGAWGMLTMTLLSAGGGVGLWYYADKLHTDLVRDRNAGLLANNDPRIQRGRWMTIGADVAFGTAVLFGFLAMYYFIRDPYPDSSANIHRSSGQVAFVPLFNPLSRSGGAQLRWSF